MDHLLIPNNPVHPRTEIQYLCKEQYSGPFDTFPARHGWGDEKLWKPGLTVDEVEELKCLLQTWLFFGLLEEVFDKPIRYGDWVRKGRNGTDVLSTSLLRSWLTDLHNDLVAETVSDTESSRQIHQRSRHIEKCLEITIREINELSIENSPLIESDAILPIAFLADVIEKSMGTERDAYRGSGSLHLGVSRVIQAQMLRDGWCVSDVHRLSHQLDLASLYLASNLDKPEAQVVHHKCTRRLCVMSQVDNKKYVTAHDTGRCDGKCKFVGVSQDKLAPILHSGAIPLISYDPHDDSGAIDLVSTAPGTRYVAISHVWSHGLGNPNDNSLPRCQMRRLTNRVNQLYGESGNDSVLFWLDTICFPVHSPAAADLALIAMRKTYADADRVLVLDRYLEAIARKPLLPIESLVRILCSSWTRRLWTLQEGALAKSLYFQFADDAIDIAQAASLMASEMKLVTTDRSLEYQPISSMVSELWEVWRTAATTEMPRKLLNYLSGGMRWRATSVAADEALCLATLAGLDMDKVIEAPATAEARMIKFWSLLPSISAQTIFWSGSRIVRPSFRWAPAKFLGEPDAIFQDFANRSFSEVDDQTSTTRTDDGLVFRCAGILLNTWRATVGRNFWIRDQNKMWYYVRRQGSVNLEPRVDEEPEVSRSLVLIMKNTLDQSFSGPSPEKSITCVIASIYDVDEEEDIIRVNTEDIAFLVPHGNAASISSRTPLVTRLVADCERLLGLPESENSVMIMPRSGEHGGEQEQLPLEQVSLPVEGAPQVQAHTSETAEEIMMETDSSTQAREESDAFQDSRPTRVKTRFEDDRLSIDVRGEHYLFDGVELSEDQTWCLD